MKFFIKDFFIFLCSGMTVNENRCNVALISEPFDKKSFGFFCRYCFICARYIFSWILIQIHDQGILDIVLLDDFNNYMWIRLHVSTMLSFLSERLLYFNFVGYSLTKLIFRERLYASNCLDQFYNWDYDTFTYNNSRELTVYNEVKSNNSLLESMWNQGKASNQ